MTFLDVVRECAARPEFVANWARLRQVSLPRSPLDAMVDQAAGHDSAIARQFMTDVYDLVWVRLYGGASES